MHPVLIPVLALVHHGWLYANTFSMAGLVVFRSPMLRVTDDMYQPVAQLLRDVPMRLVLKETIPDQSMMFGRGELEVYRPSGGFYPDPPNQGAGFLKDLKEAFK